MSLNGPANFNNRNSGQNQTVNNNSSRPLTFLEKMELEQKQKQNEEQKVDLVIP
jgi:hypothetical protein